MELFENAFEKSTIYECLFFNIKSVTSYSDISELESNQPELYKKWKLIAKTKYGFDDEKDYTATLDSIYKSKAILYPEFSKIVAITYATIESSGDKLKRNFKKIVDDNEFEVIKSFQQVLLQISSDGVKSTPQYFPTLCGHGIINNDIPLFIKKLFAYRNNFENKNDLLPYILKVYLKAKPWEANIIDILNLWKFNGIGNSSLSVISDFLNLKKNMEILETGELSEYYWNNINSDRDGTLENIALQSANHTNLAIQFMNELRSL